MPIVLIGALLLFFSPARSFSAEVMFEGYYKITLKGEHIGYSIQRYDFDQKAKKFTSISFLKIKVGDLIIQESLKAYSDDKFKPLSYQYTSQTGKDLKSIDAEFKGEIMDLKISDGKNLKTEKHKIPKGTFLSSFLVYMLLQKPLKLKEAFKYSGIAEEDGASYWGKAYVDSTKSQPNFQEVRILNQFKSEKFISTLATVKHPSEANKYVKAEVLGTESPIKTLATELVKRPTQATEGHTVPTATLSTLFGGVPVGKANLLN